MKLYSIINKDKIPYIQKLRENKNQNKTLNFDDFIRTSNPDWIEYLNVIFDMNGEESLIDSAIVAFPTPVLARPLLSKDLVMISFEVNRNDIHFTFNLDVFSKYLDGEYFKTNLNDDVSIDDIYLHMRSLENDMLKVNNINSAFVVVPEISAQSIKAVETFVTNEEDRKQFLIDEFVCSSKDKEINL